MGPKCYVSFKTADFRYREEIDALGVDTAPNTYDASADYDDERIVAALRSGALMDTTVTIFLIGTHSAESLGWAKQKYIKRELLASMLPSADDLPNAILGVVLPAACASVYVGGAAQLNDMTVVREFSRAYGSCRSCGLVRWDDFKKDPHRYIMEVYTARARDAREKADDWYSRACGQAGG
jgi:hypothetical protein